MPAQPPPGGKSPRLAPYKRGPKILADCVYLAAEACQVAMRLAPSTSIAERIREICCGFVSAGIWAYANHWRLTMSPDFMNGELCLMVNLQGSAMPDYRGWLMERELDLLSRPIAASFLRREDRATQPDAYPAATITPGAPRTTTDALVQLLSEIEDGIQICSSEGVISQLRELKRRAASIAVILLFHSPDLAVAPQYYVDGEPVIGLTVQGTCTSYRGRLQWWEFDFESGQLIAPLWGAKSWK